MAIQVALLGDDAELHARCTAALRAEPFRLLSECVNAATDVAIVLTAGAFHAELSPVGTLAFDEAIAADAQLAADFTPRELQLSCQLAARLTAARRALEQTQREADQLQAAVETDPITGLANRRSWEAARLRYVEQSRLTGQPLVMAILDLDGFKQVNTRLGYDAGDRLLAAVGKALAQAVRRHDFAARFGGDEFGLLLPGLPAEWADNVIERIRLAVGSIESEPAITASAGYAIVIASERDATEAINSQAFALADRALREAKVGGGNCTINGVVS